MENLWPQLACRERLQFPQAPAEVLTRQAALAVELAQENFRAVIPFLPVACRAARNHVAVGILPGPGARHHVIQAAGPAGDPAQAIKALAALAGVDGLAQLAATQEIQLLEVGPGRQPALAAGFRLTARGG